MKVTLLEADNPNFNGSCTVEREEGDDKYYSDSVLLHHVKKELIRQGYDVIKKRMWKDGHLVSDTEQYIRERKVHDDSLMIWWPDYQVHNAHPIYNGFCRLTLCLVGKIPERTTS